MDRVTAGVWGALALGAALLAGPGVGVAAAQAPSPGGTATVKFYVVETAGEVLRQVARKTLPGDPELRSTEIFELNRGRVQLDGQRLVNPDLLAPGWVLELPPDARGDQVRVGVPPWPDPPAPVATHGDPSLLRYALALSGAIGTVAALAGLLLLRGRFRRTAGPVTPTAAGVAGGAPPDGRRTPLPTVRLRRLLRARGNRPNAATSAAALAGLDASTVVDQALADLAAACAAVGRPMPQAHTLLLDERLLRLRLAPADDRPPAPWRATDRGRVWELDRRDVTPASPGPPPYPLLTLVGAAGGALVAVDLAQATGVVALAGDQRGARALALALARRIADRAGPAVSRITVAGFGGPVAPPANHQLWLQVADLPAEPAAAPGAAPDELLAGPATVDRHELLVLGAAPTDPARVAALVRRANRPGHLVVVAGELPGARWRWLVDPDGGVDLEPFGLRVDLPALYGPVDGPPAPADRS